MSKLRFRVAETTFEERTVEVAIPTERPSEYFGMYVFSKEKMFKYLLSHALNELTNVTDNGVSLNRSTADEVAAGIKKWTTKVGATHYIHWFVPSTEGTAEKHDAFVEYDGKGGMMEELIGKLLVQQKSDTSSFPNGDIHNAFEVHGYSVRDPSSPAFIVDDMLCIPVTFITYTGGSFDYKAPLLKALRAINKTIVAVCRYFDPDVRKVYVYLGWEQEHSLVDGGLYAIHPDLLPTGCTLMGHDSAKNQQFEDYYLGAIPTHVAASTKDLEVKTLKSSTPVKTCHNGVTPNRFELAPIFEEYNPANDHNLLIMSLMYRVNRHHGFHALLHEKPFRGVGGSDKYNNWLLGANTDILLMVPGRTPEDNLRFVTFIVNTLIAVYHHSGLLRASISSATNVHRLGANEAPSAIISSSLGKQLSQVLEHIKESTKDDLISLSDEQGMKLDILQMPESLIDSTDRNHISPFISTGNRFEFHAAGSEADCASVVMTLNAVIVDQSKRFKRDVDERIEKGRPKISVILDAIRKYIEECEAIHFDGNEYSDEWKKEAARRDLDCETSIPIIFDSYLRLETVAMLEAVGVMNQKELRVHDEMRWETHTKRIRTGTCALGDLIMNHIIPVATRYQTDLTDNIYKMRSLFPEEKAARLSTRNLGLIEETADRTAFIEEHIGAMTEACEVANRIESECEKAIAYHDTIAPALEEIRYHIDKLEPIVDNRIWTLPKYRELLLIR